MAQVLFTNLIDEQANELISWFCNSGEQDFYDACQMHDVRVTNMDCAKTYEQGEVRKDENGNLVVVMQQFEDEELDEE